MTEDGEPDDGRPVVQELLEFYARQKAARAEFTDPQLAALDALWRARRDGRVSEAAADRIERLIKDGQIAGARSRLTSVRRGGGLAASD